MGIIHLDFETYSDINIKKAGAFRYIQSPAFEILLCAYSVDDGPVRVLDLTVPQERDYFNTAFKDLIFRSDSVLMAYNAAFEAGCIARHFGVRFMQNANIGLVDITLTCHFEVKDAEVFGGAGSVGYIPARTTLKSSTLSTNTKPIVKSTKSTKTTVPSMQSPTSSAATTTG